MSISVKKVKVSQEAEVFSDTIFLPDRDARIAELAYYKAESRGFEPGHELEDWLEVEGEFLL
jgi:hypothetical protein